MWNRVWRNLLVHMAFVESSDLDFDQRADIEINGREIRTVIRLVSRANPVLMLKCSVANLFLPSSGFGAGSLRRRGAQRRAHQANRRHLAAVRQGSQLCRGLVNKLPRPNQPQHSNKLSSLFQAASPSSFRHDHLFLYISHSIHIHAAAQPLGIRMRAAWR